MKWGDATLAQLLDEVHTLASGTVFTSRILYEARNIGLRGHDAEVLRLKD